MVKKADVAPEPIALPPGCDALLTKSQICSALSVSMRNLDYMLSSGKFPKPDALIGKQMRWRVSTLNRWIDDRCKQG